MHGTWLGERDGLLLAAKHGEPAVWSNPNDIAIRYLADRYSRFEGSAIRKSSVVVPNSEATKADLERRYETPEDWDCEVIHWGVDTGMFVPLHRDSEDTMHRCNELRSRFGATKDSFLLLAVGRLAARKGHGMLLHAFSKIVESSDAHLVIIGRGSLQRRLSRLANSLGISENVTFEPGMGFEEIAEVYRAADLVVYPSYYEGQGLIPLESMASGTPVVTVDHGPLPEMVDDTVGRLFEMGNAGSMANAVLSEISSKADLQSKGAVGRKRVLDRFTLEGNAEAFLGAYERAIGSLE
jgi:glycosyltransferase involved in cell wall biosynthesis